MAVVASVVSSSVFAMAPGVGVTVTFDDKGERWSRQRRERRKRPCDSPRQRHDGGLVDLSSDAERDAITLKAPFHQ